MAKRLYEILEILVSIQLICTVFLSLALFIFAVTQDYIVYELYNSAEYLVNNSMMSSVILTAIENVDAIFITFPTFFDSLWLFFFLILSVELVIASYKVKREGYFSALGFLTFGTLIFMFILGIYTEISIWFQDNFLGLMLPNFAYITPYFTYYLNNVGLITLILAVVCILVNVIDFDVSSYMQRKKKEALEFNDEVL